MESLLAGWVRTLFSATRDVAVYWAAMKPLASPGFDFLLTRNGGRPLFRDGSNKADIRLSEMLARLDMARAIRSRAIATG